MEDEKKVIRLSKVEIKQRAKEKREQQALESAAKKDANRKYHNSPVVGDNGLKVEPGDNSRYLEHSMTIMSWPEIDYRDIDQVTERIALYFRHCINNDMKPAVAGLALALCISRTTLSDIRSGRYFASTLTPALVDIIKKAYILMENQWENYMLNGKINPVSGIFLGKNNFGYRDQQEHMITPNNPLGDAPDAAALEARVQASLNPGKFDCMPEDTSES